MKLSFTITANNPETQKTPVADYAVPMELREIDWTEVIDCGTVTFAKMDSHVSEQRVVFFEGRYWRDEPVAADDWRCANIEDVLANRRGNPLRLVNRENPGNTNKARETFKYEDMHEDERRRVDNAVRKACSSVIVIGDTPYIACDEPLLEVCVLDDQIVVSPTLTASQGSPSTVLFGLGKIADAREFAARLSRLKGDLAVREKGEAAFRPVQASTFNEVHHTVRRLRTLIDACTPLLLASGLNDTNNSKLMDFRSNIDPDSIQIMFDVEELCSGLQENGDKPEVAAFLAKADNLRRMNAFLSNQLDEEPVPAVGG
jgi:hypothetical protein